MTPAVISYEARQMILTPGALSGVMNITERSVSLSGIAVAFWPMKL